jgi:hypothetical protein
MITIFERTDIEIGFLSTTVGYSYSLPIEMPIPLMVGDNYEVLYNDASYYCTAIDGTGITSSEENIVLGNLAITKKGADTGEPFQILMRTSRNDMTCMSRKYETASVQINHLATPGKVDVLLKDHSGTNKAYAGVNQVKLRTADNGTATFINEQLIREQIQADWS